MYFDKIPFFLSWWTKFTRVLKNAFKSKIMEVDAINFQ